MEENTKALADDDEADDDDENLADNVGKPVTATDADDDTPTYTLGGSNADMFRVRANGQIEVGAKAMLDYEKKRRYMVTVMADDGYGASNSKASITVTIHVTDLDEGPTIMDKADSTAKGEKSVDEYAEDRTDAVLTLKARDPEGVTPIVWSLLQSDAGEQDLGIFTDTDPVDGADDSADDVGADDIADRALFDISQEGVLTFKAPPDFENPADAAPADNIYKVVVQASDGGKTAQLSWFKVTVTVTNVEETGKVTWTVDHDGGTPHTKTEPGLTQFRAGASLMASVKDDDVADDDKIPDNIRWQWYRSSSKTSMGTAIDGATDATYITTDSGSGLDEGGNDVGKYIHVKATYNVDQGPNEMESLGSDNPVQPEIVDNTAPEFPSPTVDRRVTENSTDAIGAPIRATDADEDDVVHYWIEGTAGDNEEFSIGLLSGELTASGLDFENSTGSGGDNTYVVTITATDSSNGDSEIEVTITVTDVNEKPTFTAGTSGMADDHAEANEILTVDTYTATDPEEGIVTLSLSGDDSDMFQLTDPDQAEAGSKVLSFKAQPDFEMPGDRKRGQHLRGDGRGLRRREHRHAVRDRQGHRL